MRTRRRRSSARRSRRRRRRNSWKGNRRGHSKAAKKGWARRRRKGTAKRKKSKRRKKRNPVASNPRRRRRRSRRRNVSQNPVRRRRRRRVRRSRGRKVGRRRRSNNPGAVSLRRPLKAVMAGFNVKLLSRAGVMVGGALGNAALSGTASGYMPGVLQSGPGSYVVGLGTAGLLGAGVGMVMPRLAGDVFLGAVLEVVTRAVKDYVVPLIPGMSGMGDYLTRTDAATARPLGDYLTRTDAATARPLGDYYGGDQYISEELAAM